MECASREQRDRFRDIIEAFAKRETSLEHNLLFESLYQPLFCSEVPVDCYFKICNLSVEDETHIAHTYCKEQEPETVKNWFKNESAGLNLLVTTLWVNDAFFRYFDGDFE